MKTISGFEWIIVLFIALLLFGVGRVSKIGKELGSAISEFRKGLNEGKESDDSDADKEDSE